MFSTQNIGASIVILLLLAPSGCVSLAKTVSSDNHTAQREPFSTKVDALFKAMDAPNRPGAAVLVFKDGKVLHRKGYGSANVEHRIPMSSETIFDLGSLAKQFTGFAVSTLIEQGLINPDDDIRHYIPELPKLEHKITIRHLVHHTSGMRDWAFTLPLAGWQLEDTLTNTQILSMAYHQKSLNFAPGERYEYTNTGYNLLAELVARVSGQSFPDWCNEHIFVPLDMQQTFFRSDHTELIANKAYGYGQSEGRWVAYQNSLSAFGSSSIFSTVNDLEKWLKNFETRKVGGKAVIDRMLKGSQLNNGTPVIYGYGINAVEYRGEPLIRHDGIWAGFNAAMFYAPAQRLGIIILGNHDRFSPSGIAYQILNMHLPAPAEVFATPATEHNEDAQPEQEQTISLTPEMLASYTGTYKTSNRLYLLITQEGSGENKRLMVRPQVASKEPLVPVSQDRFNVPAYRRDITFQRNSQGDITHLMWGDFPAQRLEDWDPSTSELEQLLGRYYGEELDTSYWIELRQGTLVARHPRNPTTQLQLLSRDEFAGEIVFPAVFKFVRNASGEVIKLLISNRRSTSNAFKKVGN